MVRKGTATAETAFKNVDLVLAMGVKFSEVSTGYYSLPQHRHLIHVDINSDNLGRIMRDIRVRPRGRRRLSWPGLRARPTAAPAGQPAARRGHPASARRRRPRINDADSFPRRRRSDGVSAGAAPPERLRCADLCRCDGLAISGPPRRFTATQPRTFFNPTNNQAMGWSIPAAIGAQRVHPEPANAHDHRRRLLPDVRHRDSRRPRGSACPSSSSSSTTRPITTCRSCNNPRICRTTATMLARLDYRSFALAMGVGYQEIR